MWDALELVFNLGRQNKAPHRWHEVLSFPDLDAETTIFTLYGETMRGTDISSFLVRSGKNHFVVVGGGYEISFFGIKAFSVDSHAYSVKRPEVCR